MYYGIRRVERFRQPNAPAYPVRGPPIGLPPEMQEQMGVFNVRLLRRLQTFLQVTQLSRFGKQSSLGFDV